MDNMDHIDRHIKQNLPPDPDWTDQDREEYAFVQLLERTQARNKSVNKHQFLKDLENNAPTIQANKIHRLWIIPAIAASILLVIYLGRLNSEVSIFDQSFQPFPDMELVRGSEVTPYIEEAFTLYNSASFAEAQVKLFELFELTNEPKYLFYAANAALGNEDYQQALSWLQDLSRSESITHEYPIYYYLGLSYLALDQVDQAQVSLNLQGSESPLYYEKAQQLVEYIRKN